MGKRAILAITFVIVILSLTFISSSTSGLKATVIANFYCNNTQYMITNQSDIYTARGYVNCQIEGFGDEVQYIQVDLFTGDNFGSAKLSEKSMHFYESGIQNFSVSVVIPSDTTNGTIEKITVYGSWHTEPVGGQIEDHSGSVNSDIINVTILRTTPAPSDSKVELGEPDFELKELTDVGGFTCLVAIIVVSSIIVLICVVYYFHRRKNKRMQNKIL